jgi:NADH-quinone oxidoreductase subunit J
MDAIIWHSVFFLLLAALACGFALTVVFADNIVRMAVYVLFSLAAVAGLFFMAGAEFLGAVQLMVYVGGTVVLLVFGVMLTTREPALPMHTSGGQWTLAAIIAGSLLAVLLPAAMRLGPPAAVPATPAKVEAATQPQSEDTARLLGLGLLGVRTDQAAQPDATLRKGMCGYLLPFELISVHLLVVLVGAAYLARPKRRQRA